MKKDFTLAESATHVDIPSKNDRFGFTMAEVLITLGIIGVVAALTMPSLIQKHQEKELAVGIRKLYADVNNAARLSQVENDGSIDYSTVFNPDNTNYETAQVFAKYFNGAKVCKDRNDKGCKNLYHRLKFSYKKRSDTMLDSYPSIVLNNGAMLYIYQLHNPDCFAHETSQKIDGHGKPVFDEDNKPVMIEYDEYACALIYFDVNGPKGPNRFGQDASRIVIEKTKIKPNAQPYEGQETFTNILTGDDKFIYEDYKVEE